MSKLDEKAEKLMETLVDGKVEVGVDFATGSITINEIEFTMNEQLELMNEYRNDPTFSKLFSQINGTEQAQQIRTAVQFDGGDFHVDPAAVEKSFGIKIGVPEKVVSIDDLINNKAQAVKQPSKVSDSDVKDAYVSALEQRVAELEYANQRLAQRAFGNLEEELTFEDFETASLADGAKEITVDDVNEIIEDLKGVEVPEYSFVLHRTGNVAVLKIMMTRVLLTL